MTTPRRGRRPRQPAPTGTAGVWLLLTLAWSASARAEPPRPADPNVVAMRTRPFPPRGGGPPRGPATTRADGAAAWWPGTAGVALALAACGWGGLAARRYWPRAGSGPGAASPLRVVGRASLSPKHAVYLLDAGGRVLIVGTGPQAAPTLLGELTGPDAPRPGGDT